MSLVKCKSQKSKRILKIGIPILVVIITISFLTAFLFVPLNRYNKAELLISSKKYDEAISLLLGSGYKDSNKQIEMAKAGKEFEQDNYEKGIDYIYNIGGVVNVSYDCDGGTGVSSTQTIKKSKYIDQTPLKVGYTFTKWSIADYKLNCKEYSANLFLNAKWSAISYSISYNLDGGNLSVTNPNEYTIEDTFKLNNPSKIGHTFLGWVGSNGENPEKEVLISKSTGDLNYTAKWKVNNYTITFDGNGGEVPLTTMTVTYNEQYTLPIPTRSGYTFAGWYNDQIEYLDGVWKEACDVVLTAKWNTITYNVTYNLNGGSFKSISISCYTTEDDIILDSPEKIGYTFLGWTGSNGDIPEKNINLNGYIGDLDFTANWEANTYTITFDPNGGTMESTTMQVKYGEPFTLPSVIRTGYTFKYWANSTIPFDDMVWKRVSDLVLTATWEATTYKIGYVLKGGTNGFLNPSKYTINSKIDLDQPYKTGYTFLGWTGSNGDIPEKNVRIENSTGYLEFVANWQPNEYNVNLVANDDSLGQLSGGGIHAYDSLVTVTAVPYGDNIFKGWYSDSDYKFKMSSDYSYTFKFSAENITLYAKFITKEQEEQLMLEAGVYPVIQDNVIMYGRYPQSLVSDISIINDLNKITKSNASGYIEYQGNEYKKIAATPYKYGTKFTDNTTTVVEGSIYYFKVEPIEWRILENNDGTYKLMSEYILINSCFYESLDDRVIDGKTIYTNNYEYSTIRRFINNEFYSEAFSLNDRHIQKILVDNSASTTTSPKNNKYVCGNTYDKVYLLSYQELTNTNYGFINDFSRGGMPTDYAIAKGTFTWTYGGTSFYSRSPLPANYNWIEQVTAEGKIAADETTFTFLGVRPAITIKVD